MKKILVILFLIMFVITIFQITTMYARYKTELQDTYLDTIGKWVVKLNGTDVSSGIEVTSVNIKDYLVYEDSDRVSGGIAPGSLVYFDLVLDPRDTDLGETDVSVKYTLEIDKPSEVVYLGMTEVENYYYKNDTDLEKLKDPSSISSSDPDMIKNNLVNIKVNEDKQKNPDGKLVSDFYTGVMPLEKIQSGYKNIIRVHFICINDESIDIQDTNTVGATVNLTLEQYKGEELSL